MDTETGNDTLGDLDFKIEIGDNADEPTKMESMGGGSKAKSGAAATSESTKERAPAAQLSDKQKKFVPRFLNKAAHPGYCMLHIGFKLLALLCYLVLGLLIDDKTFCFLVVIIISAIDFWIVKNVTGRILVGLRWWSKIDENGKETWYFESMGEQQRLANKTDSGVFWVAIYAVPLMWVLFAVTSIIQLKFSQMTICIIGCGLASVNLLGYIRCEKNHKTFVKGFLLNQAKKNISQEQMTKMGQMAAQEAFKNQQP